MEREFAIFSEGKQVGNATVIPMGLYYDVHCRCNLLDGIIRIFANCGERQENIGICVPANGEMVIRTKIPQKRLHSLQSFEAICQVGEEWIPIREGEPFTCLSRISNSRFVCRNGCPGVSIPQAKPGKNHQA